MTSCQNLLSKTQFWIHFPFSILANLHELHYLEVNIVISCILWSFKHSRVKFLDLAQSKARISGFDRVTGSSESILLKKKSKRCRFSKNKKKLTSCNWFFDRNNRVTPDFFFPCFSFNSIQFQSRGGSSFKTISRGIFIFLFWFFHYN